jgi:hypothetical protein
MGDLISCTAAEFIALPPAGSVSACRRTTGVMEGNSAPRDGVQHLGKGEKEGR